eukprot:scaffold27435_cov31-Prasinocladus_malaysianus.AAC.4
MCNSCTFFAGDQSVRGKPESGEAEDIQQSTAEAARNTAFCLTCYHTKGLATPMHGDAIVSDKIKVSLASAHGHRLQVRRLLTTMMNAIHKGETILSIEAAAICAPMP